MRFFSRIVFICNVCFVLSVLLRIVEITRHTSGNMDAAIPYQPLESTVVTLGLLVAIFLNALFVLLYIYRLVLKKMILVPRWIIYFNLMIFPLQVYYHFILR